jgi:hypothetical protein
LLLHQTQKSPVARSNVADVASSRDNGVPCKAKVGKEAE